MRASPRRSAWPCSDWRPHPDVCPHGAPSCDAPAMAKVLFPLPDRDFDVTEVAVPWRLLRDAGHEVVFATEAGATPACDPLLITGVVFGKLGARPEPIAFYRE